MERNHYQVKASDIRGTIFEKVLTFNSKSFVKPDYRLKAEDKKVDVMSYFERQLYSAMVTIAQEYNKKSFKKINNEPKICRLPHGIVVSITFTEMVDQKQFQEREALCQQYNQLRDLLFSTIRQRLSLINEIIRLGENYEVAIYVEPKNDK